MNDLVQYFNLFFVFFFLSLLKAKSSSEEEESAESETGERKIKEKKEEVGLVACSYIKDVSRNLVDFHLPVCICPHLAEPPPPWDSRIHVSSWTFVWSRSLIYPRGDLFWAISEQRCCGNHSLIQSNTITYCIYIVTQKSKMAAANASFILKKQHVTRIVCNIAVRVSIISWKIQHGDSVTEPEYYWIELNWI